MRNRHNSTRMLHLSSMTRPRRWFGRVLGLLGFAAAIAAAQGLDPGHLYTRGPSDRQEIALSFDDGPGPETPQLLELLDRHGVKATFFVLGEAVQTRKETVRDLVRRGHEVASHTTFHRNYLEHYRTLAAQRSAAAAETQARQDLVTDMRQTHLAIEKAAGVSVRLCRMPHGIDRPWIKGAARDMGYALVNWTYGADWQKGTATELLPGYLKAVRPGAILLFHDGGRNRAKSFALAEAVIRSAQQQGYSLVTVGQLLGGGTPALHRDFRVGDSRVKPPAAGAPQTRASR